MGLFFYSMPVRAPVIYEPYKNRPFWFRFWVVIGLSPYSVMEEQHLVYSQ